VPSSVSINDSTMRITTLIRTNIQYSRRRARPEKSTYCLRTLTYQLTVTPHIRWRSY